jgi:hypothetical protein
MKKVTAILFLVVLSQSIAQVGIGTTNPQAELHIGGDALVQDAFTLNSLPTVSSLEEDFQLITRVRNSTPVGEIKVLDVNARNVAPINIIDYSFTNIHLDNLTDVDLQYDENKYVVGLANFRYEGDAVKKTPAGDTFSIGHFVVRAFTSGGTWHLEIRNVDLDLPTGDSDGNGVDDFVNYYIQLIVYDKSYFRNLTPIVTDLGGSNTGDASSIPILY